ncbi:MAG: hypothetical protein WCC84_08075 [Candidatus Cybelea sp.]
MSDTSLCVVLKRCMRGFEFCYGVLKTLLIQSGQGSELFVKRVDGISVRME